MKKYRKHVINDEKGVSQVLESLIAIGISISLLLIFFITANNIFISHDKPGIDMEAKCIAIMESLLSSPGQDKRYESNWENNPENISSFGLAVSPTIAYGSFRVNEQGQIIELYKKSFYDSSIGVAKTCFLAETKIVMADGSYKNIEDVVIGDMVKSFNVKTSEITDGKVTDVLHHEPGEMGDYYLVINGFLRVTPNHQIYSNGRWVYAGELRIGDSLFYPSRVYKVDSIKKVHEKVPTYDLEIGDSHCYFVAMDTTDVLVHNPPQPENQPPVAKFTWFDIDGLNNGRTIFFDASSSTDDNGIEYYHWDFDGDGFNNDAGENGITTSYEFPDSNTYIVSLNVTDKSLSDIYTCTVQANTLNLPDIEQAPWILTGKNVYSYSNDQIFSPCDENYYVQYKNLGNNNYSFEIKEKNSLYTIIDYDKITNLSKIGYWGAKLILGLNEISNVLYSFNITIISYMGGITYYYGPAWENANAMVSNSRDVLIYHKPEVNKSDITDITPPYYENGKIILRFFIGGPPPNRPPNAPTNPNPADGTKNIATSNDLSWTCTDPDEDPLTYDVYFDTINPPKKVKSNHPTTSYDPGIMSETTTYYWKIVARDPYGLSTSGPVWSFKTGVVGYLNQPPYTPSNPNPSNGKTNVSRTADLSWTGGDPNEGQGDEVTYDVYFDTINPPKKVKNNQSDTTYDPGKMLLDTTYYWKIIAWDKSDASAEGPIWNFTTELIVNNPPYEPSNPSPRNGETNVPSDTYLKWEGGDPDYWDTVTYDVYFGTTNPPPKIVSNQSKTEFEPGTMHPSTKYYWKIVAWDKRPTSTAGPIWNFTTKPSGVPPQNKPPYEPSNPNPDNGTTGVSVNADLSWSGGDPDGDPVTYDVYFGTVSPPPKVINNQSGTTYDPPGTMKYNTQYYWKIVAWDNNGAKTEGPIWMFTTARP